MNIFVLDLDPQLAAQYHCDKHVPKLCVEVTQMMVSAARRHGATDNEVPLTKSGTPHKGGYHRHPVTLWVGDSRDNYMWSFLHGIARCQEFEFRFHREHATRKQLTVLGSLFRFVPEGKLTPFAQAMPDEFRNDDPVIAYRDYYWHDKRQNIVCEWKKGREMPQWFSEELV